MNEIELGRRLDQLESRAAIAELVTSYALACDEHDMPRLLSLFTDDAAFDSPSGAMVASGRGAIETMFIDLFKVRGPSFHWTHDHTVQFGADPNRAHGLVLAHAETCPGGVASIAAMRYQDDYRRDGGRWLFSKRVISFLYYVPLTDYLGVLNVKERLTLRGLRVAADYPESLQPWLDFDARYKR